VAAEIGPLRYMSELTKKPMNVIVNWFTLLIVFVFDPLAIAMVIALNKLIGRHDDSDNNSDESIIEEDGNEISEPTTSVDDNRREETELDQEEVQEVLEEDKKESQVRTFDDNEKVRFIPNENAKELYGENKPPVIKKVPSTNVTKGTAKTAAWKKS